MKKLTRRIVDKLTRSFGSGPEGKIRKNIQLSQPAFFNRHLGRDFLVLATGPTLAEYSEKIQHFAEKNELIVIGCNSAPSAVHCTYAGFINRYRFGQFASDAVREGIKILVSINFSDSYIKKFCPTPYDLIMYDECENPDDCGIDQNGVIHHFGTSATLMLLVAYAMGANKVYVAGMDGLSPDRKPGDPTHFKKLEYKASFSEGDMEAKYHYWCCEIMPRSLVAISNWVRENNRENFKSLTPTHYDIEYSGDLIK